MNKIMRYACELCGADFDLEVECQIHESMPVKRADPPANIGDSVKVTGKFLVGTTGVVVDFDYMYDHTENVVVNVETGEGTRSVVLSTGSYDIAKKKRS